MRHIKGKLASLLFLLTIFFCRVSYQANICMSITLAHICLTMLFLAFEVMYVQKNNKWFNLFGIFMTWNFSEWITWKIKLLNTIHVRLNLSQIFAVLLVASTENCNIPNTKVKCITNQVVSLVMEKETVLISYQLR